MSVKARHFVLSVPSQSILLCSCLSGLQSLNGTYHYLQNQVVQLPYKSRYEVEWLVSCSATIRLNQASSAH